MEAIIQKTLEDAEKLEEQIASMLAALQNNQFIKEVPELSLPLPGGEELNGNGDFEHFEVPSKRKVKVQNLTVSQRKSKSMEMDSAPLPFLPAPTGSSYELIPASTFLLPILDTCLFGITLVNASSQALNLPEMILSMTMTPSAGTVGKPCRVFNYSVQTTPLEIKQDSLENRNVAQGIPFCDTFSPEKVKKIQPGCQVLLTASFPSPMLYDKKMNSEKLKIVISILLDERPVICRSLFYTLDDLCDIKANEKRFTTHQVSVLKALGEHKKYFKVNRMLSQGDKSPYKAIQKFLSPLGFHKIFGENTGIDTSVDVWAQNQSQISLLWGSTIKIERCSRTVNSIRCCISSRTQVQMGMFISQLENWIEKEGKQERIRGLSGISISPLKSSTDAKSIVATLLQELNLLQNLIQFRTNANRNSRSVKNHDESWIREFSKAALKTDDIFMCKLF